MNSLDPTCPASAAEPAVLTLSHPLTPEALTPVQRAPTRSPDSLAADPADPGAIEYASWSRPPLYQRLGRREGITRIVRSLIENHMANPLVKTRFENNDMARLEQHAIDFVCAGTGGPESYSGRDMLAAHRGMNISEQEFVTVVDDAMAALGSNGIDPDTRNDMLAILWSLKGEIIRV